jgi:error-prone DNA polymerase
MGFYHPATLVKDAQRRGVRFHPIDVQQSDWLCRVEEDGGIRIGLMYVNGLRKEKGQAMEAFDRKRLIAPSLLCPKCGADDDKMIEVVAEGPRPAAPLTTGPALRPEAWALRPSRTYYCNICSHEWTVALQPAGRFRSIEDVAQRTGLRRDELTTLADIGALNAFTHERRSALWQVERAVRPAGEMFRNQESGIRNQGWAREEAAGIRNQEESGNSPLRRMDAGERLHADYAGTGLTLGPHPMALRRGDLALQGVMRASDLPNVRNGRRVRVAGMVITRQRPGTAKGFVFLTLEDETGISNIIVRPDLFDRERMIVVRQPFLLVDGIMQHQDGVLSVRAERVAGIEGAASIDAHDFY